MTPFAPSELRARTDAAKAVLRERGLDALLVTSPENIYYLLGLSHQGYFAFTLLVLPVDDGAALVTRAMERVTIANQTPDVTHVVFADDEEPAEAVARAVRETVHAGGVIGVEQDHMYLPVRTWERIKAALPEAVWWDASGLVDALRHVKSPAELRCVREAAATSRAAMRGGLEAAKAGANERDIAAEVYRTLILAGSEYPGFVPLIRSAERLGEEHSTWRDRVLAPGDRLFIELSGSVARYHAPMTRMLTIGGDASGQAAAAREGLVAVSRALMPGARAGEVYRAWEDAIERHLGRPPARRHHCGYSVGIGFPPSWTGGSEVVGLRPDGDLVIREGMVFHLFSWLDDWVRSDSAIVTDDGGELLTSTD